MEGSKQKLQEEKATGERQAVMAKLTEIKHLVSNVLEVPTNCFEKPEVFM